MSQRISPQRVRRALKALRERLTDEQPLTGVSLGTDGPQVVVHERGARWQVESGQVLLAFDKPEPEASRGADGRAADAARRRAAGAATSCPRRSRRSTSSAAISTRPTRSGPSRATAR